MPKYLIHAFYTDGGLRGLKKDKASGRKAAVARAIEAFGGSLENMYFAFGDDDVVVIADLPDNASAAALSIAVSSSGLAKSKTIPLLTIEEADEALSKVVNYNAPGK